MNRTLRRLDSIHSKLLNTVESIDDPLFSRCPAENEWSVAEILHHLCLVERRVTKELEKELANPSRKLNPFRKLVPTAVVAYRLVRVKAPKAMNPIDPPPKNEIIENYNAARSKLKDLCSTHGKQLKQIVFTHPFLGEISGPATVAFLGYHEVRHFKQIQEVLRKLSK